MSNCVNCHHPVANHDGDGCIYGRKTPDPCGCPFDGSQAGESVSSKYEDAVGSARDIQVGGEHYRKFEIQPWDIWLEYGLDPWLAGVIKYVLRAGHKGSKLEDLKKARHYLDRAIELEEGK
jgi:hypothetical protein